MAFLGLDGQLRRLQLLTARIGASDTSTTAMMTEFMVGAWASSNGGSSRVQLAVDGGGGRGASRAARLMARSMSVVAM